MDWIALQWVAVAVGVIFLIALHVIRFMLAVVYPRTNTAISEPPDPRFFGGLDLLETLWGDMEKAGFSDEGWIRVDHNDTSVF